MLLDNAVTFCVVNHIVLRFLCFCTGIGYFQSLSIVETTRCFKCWEAFLLNALFSYVIVIWFICWLFTGIALEESSVRVLGFFCFHIGIALAFHFVLINAGNLFL